MTIHEPARDLPIVHSADVIVCGGGPAGVAAAVAAARAGADTCLIEVAGCLGGIWTSGLMAHVIDYQNKSGILADIMAELKGLGEMGPRSDLAPEAVKWLLEKMCTQSGVRVRLHTRVVAAVTEDRTVQTVITESKSGREAWQAKAFIDCTGDGDLGALAGCEFAMGRPGNGECQPMSLCALLSGVEADAIAGYIIGRSEPHDRPKKALKGLLEEGGLSPSYSAPSIFEIHDNLFALMVNHEYGVKTDSADDVTEATLRGRAEVFEVVRVLRQAGPAWKDIRLVATAGHIGVREGRRLKGRYTVTTDDLASGRRHADAVCECTFCVDIHSTNPSRGKGLGTEGHGVQPYDIPLRALISADRDNLLFAGRCISGDFHAHGSYRVTGNAVPMGEAAGACAALLAQRGTLPSMADVRQVLSRTGDEP